MKNLIAFGIMCVLSVVAVSAQEKVQFKVEGWSCQSCANSTAAALNKMKGVSQAQATFDNSSVILTTDGSVTEEELRTLIADLNFQAFFEGDEKPVPLTEAERKGLDIQVVKGGDKIKFQDYLTEGKLTIFDFYADWCGPCKLFTPKLERLVLNNPKELKLVQVDVVDWKSDIAKYLTFKYQMPALPFALIFDEDGKMVAKITGNDIEAVEKAIASN